MNRHRAYWPLDDAPAPDGDGALTGIDALNRPSSLPEGYGAYAENARFDTGAAATRPGYPVMGWASRWQVGDSAWICRPLCGASEEMRAVALFADPYSGIETVVIVTNAGVFAVRPGNLVAAVSVPGGESLDGVTDLVQTWNGLVLLRGRNEPPLYLEALWEGFKALPEADSGKERLPNSTQGIYFGNRFFAVDARMAPQYVDTVWVSDFGGVASVLQGDPIFNAFRINQGGADRVVALYKWNDTTLIVAKERSVYAVSNIYGTNEELAAGARLDEVTRQYGCIAPKSFTQVGSDVWFLGHRRGVCSLRQTEVNAVQGVDVPVSRSIQSIVDRINWEAAAGAVAASHDNRVYFAVPIDGSTTNNAILVYSLLTQRWAGVDLVPFSVFDFVRFGYGGGVRLGVVSTSGTVHLCESGWVDQIADADGVVSEHPIEMVLRTRGYGGRVAGTKRYHRLSLRVRTWAPAYTVSLVPDGPGEGRQVASVTKSRVRYYRPYNQPDWDPTNANDDFDTPFREDYSVQLPLDVHAWSGVRLNVLQEVEESWRLRDRAQGMQVEIRTTAGRLEVAGVAVETMRGPVRDGSTS